LEWPKRKSQRLKGYDYSQSNAYFITICTQNRCNLFGEIANDFFTINKVGEMVAERLSNISNAPGVTIDKYVIMPNHVHMIILISDNGTTSDGTTSDGTTQGSFPTATVSELIQRFKTITTKLYIDGVKNGSYAPFDKKIWQKSFHDHIIRNETEYLKIWKYIDENPIKWAEDTHYCIDS